jgi:hypothetical protein
VRERRLSFGAKSFNRIGGCHASSAMSHCARAVADAIEARPAVVVAAHRLAVDDAAARAQPRQSFDDQREATREVITGRL